MPIPHTNTQVTVKPVLEKSLENQKREIRKYLLHIVNSIYIGIYYVR